MSISKSITEDIKNAMKNKEKDKLEALRAIKTAFLLAKTEKGAQDEIDEAEELKIIQKLVKQRRDSAVEFEKQNRADLAEKETFEADVIAAYLPQQMSEQEIEEAVKAAIEKSGASSVKEMGKVMGIVSKELAGKADNKIVADKVKQLLA